MSDKTDKTLLSFLKDRPIAYHPILAKKLKSVKAAVFLSQLLYWYDKGKSPDGWIYKNALDFYEETGLSREEQETARKKLLEKNLIEHELRGVPATSNYRVLEQNYIDFLTESDNQIGEKIQSSLDKTPKLDWRKTPNLIGEKLQTRLAKTPKLDGRKTPNYPIDYTEITTEITTENTSLHDGGFDDALNVLLAFDFGAGFKPIQKTGAKKAIEAYSGKIPVFEFVGLWRDWVEADGNFEGIKNPAGYLLSKISAGELPPEPEPEETAAPVITGPLAAPRSEKTETQIKAGQLWDEIREAMPQYKKLFTSANAIDLLDDRLTVQFANEQDRQMIIGRSNGRVREMATSLCGRPVEVVFEGAAQ